MHLLSFPQPPTPESIQAAKSYMESERRRLGVYTVIIPCSQCTFEAEAQGLSEGQAEGFAVRRLIRHLLDEHSGTQQN